MQTPNETERPRDGDRDAAVPRLYQNKYRIPSARLQHYDYASAGMYFVTINALHHQCIFGHIADHAIVLSSLGNIIQECWSEIPMHFGHIELAEFQIMPNHLHGILFFVTDGKGFGELPEAGRKQGAMQAGSLSVAINSFKGAVTFRARQEQHAQQVWQPRFHEHVIRNEQELGRIREYIITNPDQWEADRYYAV